MTLVHFDYSRTTVTVILELCNTEQQFQRRSKLRQKAALLLVTRVEEKIKIKITKSNIKM